MATTQKLSRRMKLKHYDFDPDATAVTQVAWEPMEDALTFMASFFRTIGSSAVTFDIAAATDAAGSNVTQVKAHAVAAEPDAVGDQIFLEVRAEDVLAALPRASHVTARVSVATATDEGVVSYVFGDLRAEEADQTADAVA